MNAWRRQYRPIAELTAEELREAREQNRPYLLLADVLHVYSMPALQEIMQLARECAA